VPLLRKKAQAFDLQIQDFLLRVNAPQEFYEECRAAALSMWEQLQSYSIRSTEFRTSRRPVEVPDSAPPVVREMAAAAAAAGVGPVYTIQGALTDHVGRYLARGLPDVIISSGGDYFMRSRKRMKLPVYRAMDGTGLSVIVDSRKAPAGVSTNVGSAQLRASNVDGLAVVAASCMLADAAAAAAMAILTRQHSFPKALAWLRRIDGVHGAVVVRGNDIGVAGAVEVAA
jgi:uncharacterized protein